MTAKSLILNIPSHSLILKGNVLANYANIQLKSTQAIYTVNDNTLIFNDNAHIKETLIFYSDSILLEMKKNQLTGKGHATFEFPPYSGRSDTIRYNKNKETLELSGQPVIFKDKKALSAEKIIIDLNKELFNLVDLPEFDSQKIMTNYARRNKN